MKRSTTSSEFLLWMVYREHLINDFHREDYFLAQIAAVISGLFRKDAKVKDFLIQFYTEEELEEKAVSDEEAEERAARRAVGSMAATMGAVIPGVSDVHT